jgi:flagellar protein FlaF
MSYAAYASTQKAVEGPRDLEIRVISHITSKLVAANDPRVEPIDRIRALNGNIRLWSLLSEDLSDPGNGLPAQVKANYLSIGIFARKASLAALTAKTDLSTLIKINTDVLDALESQRRAA